MFALSLALTQTRQGSPGIPTTPATFTMTQLARANRPYQRSTIVGGGQSKGQGTIPVTLNPTVIGTVYARCRDAVGGVTILQASFLAGTVSSTGSQTFNVAGLDARLGQFFLDLSGDGVTFINGTTAVSMGSLAAGFGQSLWDRMLRVQDTGNPTLATMGQTINAHGYVYAAYAGDANVSPPASAVWAKPADATIYDSAGAAEFLNLMVSMLGVDCGLVGYAVGGTAISTWQPGQTNYINATTMITNAGNGFEYLIWWQGHSDAAGNTTYAAYQAGLTGVIGGLIAQSTVITPKVLMCTISNIVSTGWGTASQQQLIRRSASDWCAANSATYVPISDLSLNSGGTGGSVHQFQIGSVFAARHFYRAIRGLLGISSVGDKGPTITGVSRASGSKNVIFTTDAVSLNVVGAPDKRQATYYAFNTAGGLGLDATTPFTAGPGANQFTIQLSAVPTGADATALNAFMFQAIDTIIDGSANMIYDNVTDGDGITLGRQLQPNMLPIVAAAPTPSKALTLVSPAYTAGPGAPWGQWMTGGRGTANDFHSPSQQFSYELRLLASTAPVANAFLCGDQNSGGIYLDTANTLSANYYNNVTATTLVGPVVTSASIYHALLEVDETGAWLYANGVLVASNTSTLPNSTSRTQVFGGRVWGTNTGTAPPAGIGVQELAVWNSVRYRGANFTPPTAPYVGTEGMVRLWRLDGNGNEVV